MIYVDFCKGPKGLWIGCAEYNNGKYFATGRTMDIMMKNIKTGGAKKFDLSQRHFMLASYQMEPGEFEQKYYRFMSKLFQGKFWNLNTQQIPKRKQETTQNSSFDIELTPLKSIETNQQENKKEEKYTYEVKDGVLYVYERKLVAKYDIENK